MPREDEVPEFCNKLALSPIRLRAMRSGRGEPIRLKKVVDEVQGLIAVDRGEALCHVQGRSSKHNSMKNVNYLPHVER